MFFHCLIFVMFCECVCSKFTLLRKIFYIFCFKPLSYAKDDLYLTYNSSWLLRNLKSFFFTYQQPNDCWINRVYQLGCLSRTRWWDFTQSLVYSRHWRYQKLLVTPVQYLHQLRKLLKTVLAVRRNIGRLQRGRTVQLMPVNVMNLRDLCTIV